MSCLFFFFKQKTAYEMRISDWSSDVCSSDLRRLDMAVHDRGGRLQPDAVRGLHYLQPLVGVYLVGADDRPDLVVQDFRRRARQGAEAGQIGRAACWDSGGK